MPTNKAQVATRYHCALSRAEVKGDTLYGHASVFEQPTKLGEVFEVMSRSAFDTVMEDDVRALFNHDPNLVLGRSASKTLRFEIDSEGLPFEVDLPDTSYGHDLRVSMERGDIDGASFKFYPFKIKWEKHEGRPMMRHEQVERLVDLSVVTFPAYKGAGAALRMETDSERVRRSQLIMARASVLLGDRK